VFHEFCIGWNMCAIFSFNDCIHISVLLSILDKSILGVPLVLLFLLSETLFISLCTLLSDLLVCFALPDAFFIDEAVAFANIFTPLNAYTRLCTAFIKL